MSSSLPARAELLYRPAVLAQDSTLPCSASSQHQRLELVPHTSSHLIPSHPISSPSPEPPHPWMP